MNIALIGATGFIGSAILAELLQRGHQVTALARQPDKVPAQPGLTVVQADVQRASEVAHAVKGHDAVISAFNAGWTNPHLYDDFLAGSKAITAGVKAADVERLLVVGGAGSLYVAPGVQLVDTPSFPEQWKVGATAARDALKWLQNEQDLAWTFLSPPAMLHPGERTGHFRVGGDELLMNAKGDAPAEITSADLAVAIVNEIEAPQHLRRRFTVGY